MLTKLLTTAPDELDMEEAYKYQYLFTYETLNDNTRLLLDTVNISHQCHTSIITMYVFQMFSYISINSLFSNLEDQEAINWKYFLYSISVCVRNHKNAFKILEGELYTVCSRLKDLGNSKSYNDGRMTKKVCN